MSDYRYYHPIEVRYGDLDPQGHLNNAKYLTYMEQGRISYVKHLGLWESESFMDLGIILAEIKITFLAPILFGQPVRVGVRTSRLGNKSLNMEHCLEDAQTGLELAEGSSVLVTYDYRSNQTVPVPDRWRQAISEFEGLPRQN
jgi:acyl-CoA thioester hydrolase